MTTSVALSPILNAQTLFLADGITPNAGGLIYSYSAGTTTPKVTYTENTGTTANTNPIVLDAGGRLPQPLWLMTGAGYDFLVKDQYGATVSTAVNIIVYDVSLYAIDAIFPTGATIPFYMASPPTGWSTVPTIDNRMMRVVLAASSGGTGGGSDSPILMDVVPSHTHVAVSEVTESPHSHGIDVYNVDTGGAHVSDGSGSITYTGVTTAGAVTGLTVATTNSANADAANWTPAYSDFCLGRRP